MDEHEGAERGAKREALPQLEPELARPAKRTFIVTPDTNPISEEQRCNAELKEENKKLQLQMQLLTEQVSSLLQSSSEAGNPDSAERTSESGKAAGYGGVP
eukprot:3413432-Amphidinium_carterae.2